MYIFITQLGSKPSDSVHFYDSNERKFYQLYDIEDVSETNQINREKSPHTF